jgi:subtilisin family serine protease
MRRVPVAVFAASLLVLGACAPDVQSPVAPEQIRSAAAPLFAASGDRGIEGQYIIVLEEGADPRSVAAIAKVEPGFVYQNVLTGFSATLNQGQLNALRHNPNVKYVEADMVVTAEATQSGATWGLDRIDQRNLPLNGTYTYTPTGSGVKAYIIDTGILASHSQFSGGRVIAGATAISDGRGTTDCNGHGTHVAGTVGGSTYGVAKAVTLVPVRVLDCAGSGANSGVIAGMDWVVSNHGAGQPAVANMSLGGPASTTTDAAVNRMISDGVTVVVAAGNENQNACNVSPARVSAAVTVGATTSTDARASYSNFGSCVDVFAPGSSITSAWYTSTTATNTISGTSMASPHVAGVAALYLQGNPSASPATVKNAILSTSTTGVVSNAGTGSPNRLVYSLLR